MDRTARQFGTVGLQVPKDADPVVGTIRQAIPQAGTVTKRPLPVPGAAPAQNDDTRSTISRDLPSLPDTSTAATRYPTIRHQGSTQPAPPDDDDQMLEGVIYPALNNVSATIEV